MRWIREWANALRFVLGQKRKQRELDGEMRFHLEEAIDDLIEQGYRPGEARRLAMKEFGGVEKMKEECRDSWGTRIIVDLIRDLRNAGRQIVKHKAHAAIIVLTLGLCMGSNTTVYNFVVKIVTRPYDFADSERIVVIGKRWDNIDADGLNSMSIPNFKYIQENNSSFTSVGFGDQINMDFEMEGRTRSLSVDRVTPEVWPITGVSPLAGRLFIGEDVIEMDGRLVVLNERLWEELGGRERNLMGEHINLNGKPYRILGVVPQNFYLGPSREEALIPRLFSEAEIAPKERNNNSYTAIAKLKPGVSVEQANHDLASTFESLMDLYPNDKDDHQRRGTTFVSMEINKALMANIQEVGVVIKSVQAVTFLVLVIGCLNVGGMILVKGYSGIQDLAMRKALGASGYRLVQQIYVEIIAYFLLGGLLSLLVLQAGLSLTESVIQDQISWAGDWSIDTSSLGLTFLVALIAALLTGLLPLLSILRRELMEFVKAGNRTASGSASKNRLHSSFVISQVSLSVILLVGAGVLALNLNATLQKELGFVKEGRIAFDVPQPNYRFAHNDEVYASVVLPLQDRILSEIRSMPGVVSASASNRIPISSYNQGHSHFSMHHYAYQEGEPKARGLRMVILPGYFETVGTKILLGRDFSETDNFDSEGVVIISQNMMERYYQGLNPIGMSIKFWGRDLKIVGVAEQVQDKPFFENYEDYTLYFPFKQWNHMNRANTAYVVHVQGDAEHQLGVIEQAILRVDPRLIIFSSTFEEFYQSAILPQRFPMLVTTFFSGFALFLSGLGLYGLISFTVAERAKEYGIRMALGARGSRILKRVLSGSGRLVAGGLVVGLLISIILCIQLNPLLEEVNTLHPLTFAGVVSFVIAICLLASFVPAHRATRIDIVRTLSC